MPFYILPFKPFSASFCPLVLGAEIKPPREAHHTFYLSVFTFQFNMRRRHLTFQFSVFTFHFTCVSSPQGWCSHPLIGRVQVQNLRDPRNMGRGYRTNRGYGVGTP